jgi:hypothetical protein|tara:strand:- start:851 stop:1555 length:705 start_codon:yes stop_codon:yes gene_type:complete
MKSFKIKLHNKHIPLNSNLILNSQEEYDFHIETLLFLNHQIDIGFKPDYFITFHYRHPSERYSAQKQTNNELGFKDRYGIGKDKSLWKEIPKYNYYDKRRNDYDLIVEDTYEIRNVLAKELYGIKRINHLDKFPPMFFFHELGKAKLQYHTHLLLPKINIRNNQFNLQTNTAAELEYEFDTTIRGKRKCFSAWKQIHIREVDNPYVAVSYVNKETTRQHMSLDYQNSIFLTDQK